MLKQSSTFSLDEENTPGFLSVDAISPSSERDSCAKRESFLNRSNAKTLSFSLDEDNDTETSFETQRQSFLNRQNCKSHSFSLDGEDEEVLPTSSPKRTTILKNFEKLSIFRDCATIDCIHGDTVDREPMLPMNGGLALSSESHRKSFLERQHAKSHSFSIDEEGDNFGELPGLSQPKISYRPFSEDQLVHRPSWART